MNRYGSASISAGCVSGTAAPCASAVTAQRSGEFGASTPNICIYTYIINAKPPAALERFQQYRMGDVQLCSMVDTELAFGVAKSGSTRNRQALEIFLAPLTVLPFDDAAA